MILELNDTDGYNGWTNRDTWLVNLWLDNDYGSYAAKLDRIAAETSPIDAAAARRIFDDLGASDIIGDEFSIENVNFDEIAVSWEDDRLEGRSL